MLSLLLLIPFLGSLLLVLWPGQPAAGLMRKVALVVLCLQVAWSVVVLLSVDPQQGGLQLQETLPWIQDLGLTYSLAIDGLSLPLVVINGALSLVAVICTRDISQRPRLYFALLLLISGAVNGAFLAQSLVLFLLFFVVVV
ncbi:MAG: NAD(P)H-quinone oxidoreductase subunit D4, partial [Cyanobacteriota bacterium]